MHCGPNGSGVPVSRNGHYQAMGQTACAKTAPEGPPSYSGEAQPLPGYGFL